MQRKATVIAATVLAALAVGAATASANRLWRSNLGIRIVWARVLFDGIVRCAVTLEGTLHGNSHAKTENLLIGHITRAIVTRPCEQREWTARFLTPNEGVNPGTLPWHIRYDSYTGTLPRITGVRWRIVGMAWEINNFIERLFTSSELTPVYIELRTDMTTGRVEGVRLLEERRIFDPFFSETALEGVGAMTLLGNSNAIVVRLI